MCLAEYAGHLRGDGEHDIEIDLGEKGQVGGRSWLRAVH
jgi:hypothetical protein